MGSLHLTLEDKVSVLNSALLSVLDCFAPRRSQAVPYVRSAAWYNEELCSKKAACRKMEHRWRLSGLNVHHLVWKDHLNYY